MGKGRYLDLDQLELLIFGHSVSSESPEDSTGRRRGEEEEEKRGGAAELRSQQQRWGEEEQSRVMVADWC